MRRSIGFAPLLGLCVALVLGCSGQSESPGAREPSHSAPAVRQVDHVLIEAHDASALFSLLAETLQLPIAWPMADYGGFASGGVFLGNVNLEVVKASSARAFEHDARFKGLALEPEPLDACLAELEQRGIVHGRPAPFRSRDADGELATRWTTVALPSVSNDALEVFLCEYASSQAAKRAVWSEQLRARSGGPLALVSLRTIVCGATNLERSRARWRELLGPSGATPAEFLLRAGPALRVVAASSDEIVGVVLEVESLLRAREVLSPLGLLGEVRSDSLVLGGPRLQGLSVTLVQRGGD